MNKETYSSVEEAQAAFDAVPSYFERFTTSVEIEGETPVSSDWCYCLSCGQFVADESHECSRERVA